MRPPKAPREGPSCPSSSWGSGCPSSLCPPPLCLASSSVSDLCLPLAQEDTDLGFRAPLGDFISRSLSYLRRPFFQVRPHSEVLGIRMWIPSGPPRSPADAREESSSKKALPSIGLKRTRLRTRPGTRRPTGLHACSQSSASAPPEFRARSGPVIGGHPCVTEPSVPSLRRGGDDADAERTDAPDPHAEPDAQSPAPVSARARAPAPPPTGRLHPQAKSRGPGGSSSRNPRICGALRNTFLAPALCSSLKLPNAPSPTQMRNGLRSSGPLEPDELCWSLPPTLLPSWTPAHRCSDPDPILSQEPCGGEGSPGAAGGPLKRPGVCHAEDPQWARPAVLRAKRQKPLSVHHHYHYAPPAPLQASPTPASPAGYSTWPPVVSATALPPAASFLPTMWHVAGPSVAALST